MDENDDKSNITPEMKISDLIKKHSSVTLVSDRLNYSRPTLYKYMENYDNMDFDSIPPDVIEYFNTVVSAKSNSNDLSIYQNFLKSQLTSQIKKRNKALMTRNRIEIELEKITNELHLLDKKKKTKKAEEMKAESRALKSKMNVNAEEIARIDSEIEKLQICIETNEREIVKNKTMGNMTCNIETKCFRDNNKFMIVYDRENAKGVNFTLNTYVKFDEKYILLKKYEQQLDRNYFLVDDIIADSSLYYAVHSHTESRTELKGTEETSGMCKLIS